MRNLTVQGNIIFLHPLHTTIISLPDCPDTTVVRTKYYTGGP